MKDEELTEMLLEIMLDRAVVKAKREIRKQHESMCMKVALEIAAKYDKQCTTEKEMRLEIVRLKKEANENERACRLCHDAEWGEPIDNDGSVKPLILPYPEVEED